MLTLSSYLIDLANQLDGISRTPDPVAQLEEGWRLLHRLLPPAPRFPGLQHVAHAPSCRGSARGDLRGRLDPSRAGHGGLPFSPLTDPCAWSRARSLHGRGSGLHRQPSLHPDARNYASRAHRRRSTRWRKRRGRWGPRNVPDRSKAGPRGLHCRRAGLRRRASPAACAPERALHALQSESPHALGPDHVLGPETVRGRAPPHNYDNPDWIYGISLGCSSPMFSMQKVVMPTRTPAVAASLLAALAVALGLAACGSSSSSTKSLALVAYSTPQGAYEALIPAFQATSEGKGVSFSQSYGPSGRTEPRGRQRPARRRRQLLAATGRRKARQGRPRLPRLEPERDARLRHELGRGDHRAARATRSTSPAGRTSPSRASAWSRRTRSPPAAPAGTSWPPTARS